MSAKNVRKLNECDEKRRKLREKNSFRIGWTRLTKYSIEYNESRERGIYKVSQRRRMKNVGKIFIEIYEEITSVDEKLDTNFLRKIINKCELNSYVCV